MTELEQDRHRRATVSRFFTALQAGDYAALQEILTADAVTRWPQTGERMTSALSLSLIHI